MAMEPEHFNWLEACNAVVRHRHALYRAELEAARHPDDSGLREAWVLAWQAHHVAVNDEFMTRIALGRG
jgi:hypothetical protein